jgi:CheY-like chemotaxis protein
MPPPGPSLIESRLAQCTRPVAEFEAWTGAIRRANPSFVDDESAVRDLIHQTLLRHDYRISEAANGAEALVLLAQRENGVDLVIADLPMPVLNGASLIRELHRRRPLLPIVAMSGNIARDQIAPETKAAIRALLPKPFDATQLLAAIDVPAG